jgi:hypothetical protein
MRSEKALARAIRTLRAGGRFVAAGAKLAGGMRGLVLDQITIAYSLPAITTRSGLDRPWSLLEIQLGALKVEEHLLGMAYVTEGVKGNPWVPASVVAGTR